MAKPKQPVMVPIHDPKWVNRRCRELAGRLNLGCRVWYKEDGQSFLMLGSKTPAKNGQKKVYLSAGIHGDEPGSVLGLIEWLGQSDRWMSRFHFTIFPCLNPWGLKSNSRHDSEHRDLNRCYAREDVPSIVAHREVIKEGGPYDLALMLHEDYDAEGMYVYEVSSDPQVWGHELIGAASGLIPPDPRVRIEGRTANRGVLKRNLKSKAWQSRFKNWGFPEAVHLYMHHCPRVYTLETPSEMDIHLRAKAHVLAVNKALEMVHR